MGELGFDAGDNRKVWECIEKVFKFLNLEET